ncbi:MAG TPA: proline--tRNA ligase [Candidatus Dormibacteraeota bacterium]|jgi:prolyl-tRNA synthetase|nr:proline--tRNA ligase [Candidatus Dormibacteraeota bacterium]
MSERDPKQITPKSEDFDRWYTDVVRRAELADYTPIGGFMVVRPYGWALWEHSRDALDAMIKRTGHENMQFPLLIPESYLKKEAQHVEGFAPEVAWVTHGGDKELEERLAIRPTSETIICSLYSKWIHSWRDLPVLINQWANVVRWEKRTRLFLRTTEFWWQEGHTFHETSDEAAREVETMLGVYRELAEDWLCMAVIPGRKTESEKFAGAQYTLSIEACMSDGLALQAGTSHHLGQNFTRAYDIAYTDRSNELQNPYQTSWGLSTRVIGGLIMAHGDDAGLVLPPKVAPIQVIVVPIVRSNDPEGTRAVEEAVEKLEREAQGLVRMRVDRREGIRPGEKYAHWELRGVPLRIVVGTKDLAEGVVTVVRRLDGEQTRVPVDNLAVQLPRMLDEAHHALRARSQQMLESFSREVSTLDELRQAFEDGPVWANAPFCNRPECEVAVKAAVHAVTVRNLRADRSADGAPCIACGQPAGDVAVIARAY